MPEKILAVEHASVSYGKGAARCNALQDVSLEFAPSSLNLIMGPSGSGKTTLLSLLGCLLVPDSGNVYVDDNNVSRMSEPARVKVRRENIGFVFQAFRLFEALSAEENVVVGAQVGGVRSKSDRSRRAAELLEQFGMKEKALLKPNELSGGEKQRVAIARALVKRPPILLADEPTASLDSKAGEQIAGVFRELAEQQNLTVVVVSHDVRWERFAHRTIQLHDGRIVEGENTHI